MASSGSISGSIKDGHYVVRVDWTQTKDLSANTSTIEAKIYLINDWSLSISGRSDNTISIDGTSQKFTSPSISTTGTHLLNTVTQTVSHDSNGAKSLTIDCTFLMQQRFPVCISIPSRQQQTSLWTPSQEHPVSA